MKPATQDKKDNTNNYFLLKCLAGVAAAAVIAVGISAAILAAKAGTAAAFAIGGPIGIIGGVIGLAVTIGILAAAICLLSSATSAGYRTNASIYPDPMYYRSPWLGFWPSTSSAYYPRTGGVTHTRGSGIFSHSTHAHPSAAQHHVHTHVGGSGTTHHHR